MNVKYESLPKAFIMLNTMDSSTIMYSFFILNIEETIRATQYGFVITVFVQAFTTHLLKKNQDCFICLRRDVRVPM
jgi:hypothetical protein